MPLIPPGITISVKIELRPVAAGQPFECFLGAVRDDRFEAEFVEHAGRELGDQLVVLDDKHPAEPWLPLALVPPADRSAARRQVEGERRALARFGLDGDCAADLLGEAEHLAEAEAGALRQSSWW